MWSWKHVNESLIEWIRTTQTIENLLSHTIRWKKIVCRKLDEMNFTYVKFTIRFDNSLQSYKFDLKKNNDNKKIFDNYNEIWTLYMQSFRTRISHKNRKKIFFVWEIYSFQFTAIWAKYLNILYLHWKTEINTLFTILSYKSSWKSKYVCWKYQ